MSAGYVLFSLLISLSPVAQSQGTQRAASVGEGDVAASRPPTVGPALQLPVGVRDLGPAPASMPMRRMQVVLARSAQQEQALIALLDQQQDKSSPNYRKWLTPAAFGAAFGASDHDLGTVTAWLTSQGFWEVHVNAGRTLVEFSGSTAAVQSVFHTSIHQVSMNGETGYAATVAPALPAELSSLVTGFASLNNLSRSSSPTSSIMLRRDKKTGAYAGAAAPAGAKPDFTVNSNRSVYYGITPYDFAAIYNVTPLWNAATAVDGSGEAVAIVGESDINPADFVAFRNLFSLPLGDTNTPTGTQFLNIIYNGNNPGVQSSEFHADSDTQWTAAVAKGAQIIYVASQTTEATSGNELSASYIVDNNLAPILVDSYYTCEQTLGSGGNAFYKNLWQQAASQGITVVAATGDSGAAECDAFHVAPASAGKAVNGIASTAYNVAVGGTEFFTPNGAGSYFNPANYATEASATGYIPEIPWNDTCTNPAVDTVAPYTGLRALQVCNNSAAIAAGLVTTAGTGGGASSLYAKPAWQKAPGVPSDSARDIPDVSLFASQGRTNTFYVVCQQDRNADGNGCNLNAPYADFAAYGGTEISAPAFGGVLAMAAQRAGERIGNPNMVLYTLASRQASAGTACNATGANAAGCIFHDLTMGTNAMPCVTGSKDCVSATSGDATGILSVPSATAGYDLASGLGSVNAYNLVESFTTVTFAPTSAILSVTPSTVVHGSPVVATVSVSGGSGTPSGDVSINAITPEISNASVGGGPLVNGSLVETFRNFPGGSYGVKAHYEGNSADAATDSNYVSLVVTPEPSATTIQTFSFNPTTGTASAVTSAPYGNIYYLRFDVKGKSSEGSATGDISIEDNGQIFGSGVARLNSSGYTEAQNNAIAPGRHVFTASYSGDPSFDASTAAPATLVITKAATTTTGSTSLSTVSIGSIVTLSAVVDTTSFGYDAPSGTVVFESGKTILGTSQVLETTDPATGHNRSTATLTLSAEHFPTGSEPVTVVYGGDLNYLGSSSVPTPLTVTGSNLTPTVTFVFPTPDTVYPDGSILYTAIITPASPSPTGTVQFIVDGENVGPPQAVVPGGFAALQTTAGKLVVGSHTLTATYSGDTTHYRSSNSNISSFLVTSPATGSFVNFTAVPTTLVQGTFVSIATTVTPTSPVPTGTAQLLLDGSLYGAKFPLVNGVVTLPLVTMNLQVGKHSLNVAYSGGGNYQGSYGTAITLTISAPGATKSEVAIIDLPALVGTGLDATFSASITPTSPTPTGIVQITLDSGNPGPPILITGAVTSLSIPATSLSNGVHTVKVFYSGDDTYAFSTSPTLSFTVGHITYVGDFTLTPAAQTVTFSRLEPVKPLTYMVTPEHGFNAPVTFSCSNLPEFTSCLFTPNTLNAPWSGAATTKLTFQFNTGVHAEVRDTSLISARNAIALAVLLGIGLPLGYVGRRRMTRLLLALFLVSLATAFSGCGSGHLKIPGLTPLGTFTVDVTAAAPNAVHTATIKLTVDE